MTDAQKSAILELRFCHFVQNDLKIIIRSGENVSGRLQTLACCRPGGCRFKTELAKIEGNDDEIKDRFAVALKFGTAGLRGVLGAGTNR